MANKVVWRGHTVVPDASRCTVVGEMLQSSAISLYVTGLPVPGSLAVRTMSRSSSMNSSLVVNVRGFLAGARGPSCEELWSFTTLVIIGSLCLMVGNILMHAHN